MKIVKGLSVGVLILFLCGLFYTVDEHTEVNTLDKPIEKGTIEVSKLLIIMMRLLSQQ